MTSSSQEQVNASVGLHYVRPAEGPVRMVRRLLCGVALACSLGVAPGASATSFSTDQSDLWYVPTESGWGMQLVQRDSIIFATIFVYNAGSQPTWFVATLANQGGLSWSGDLLATTGPWFGGFFDPNAVGVRKVGTMTWSSVNVTTGSLSYSVDGVNVVKTVIRQTLGNEDYEGHYAGGSRVVTNGCVDPLHNTTIEDLGSIHVTQNLQTITLTIFPLSYPYCTYVGTLTQAGQMGAFAGSYNCADGETGSFGISELQVNVSGMTGRFTSRVPTFAGCQGTGNFGGARVNGF